MKQWLVSLCFVGVGSIEMGQVKLCSLPNNVQNYLSSQLALLDYIKYKASFANTLTKFLRMTFPPPLKVYRFVRR